MCLKINKYTLNISNTCSISNSSSRSPNITNKNRHCWKFKGMIIWIKMVREIIIKIHRLFKLMIRRWHQSHRKIMPRKSSLRIQRLLKSKSLLLLIKRGRPRKTAMIKMMTLHLKWSNRLPSPLGEKVGNEYEKMPYF